MNANQVQPELKYIPRWGRIALLLLALVGGLWFYHLQSRAMRQEVEKDLTAIAQLKVDQIAAWRRDQLEDADWLMPLAAPPALRYLADPGAENEQALRATLQNLADQHGYAEILLLDREGAGRWSLSGSQEHYHEYLPALETALQTGQAVFIDLHRENRSRAAHVSVVAPLSNQADSPGALVLIHDAAQFLYPLIQSWPLPSQSAETLLVRREGDAALFLNDLRHQTGAALELRIPLSQADVPAALAVLGVQGFMLGRDYRGVEVAAVLMPVPDSPWYLIAKVDADEAFSEWHFRSVTLLITFAGFLAFSIAAGLAWQQRRQTVRYRALYHTEAALRSTQERHAVTLRSIGDAVIATDVRGQVEMLNPAAAALTGWTEAQARGKALAEVFVIVNAQTGEAADPVGRVLESGQIVGLANHTLLIARDGRQTPIADSAAPIRNGGAVTGVVLVFRDQSEAYVQRQIQQARLRLFEYASTHSLEELLTKTLDEAEALTGSTIGFYHFVLPDQETLSLQAWSTRTKKEFCTAEGQGRHHSISEAGVWVDCIQARGPVIHNDYAALPHRKGLPEGHAVVQRELVVPVMRSEQIVAILGVGNKASDYTPQDVATLQYFADVGWEVAEKKRADETQARQQALLEAVYRDAPLVMMVVDGERRVRQVNGFATQFAGRSVEEMLGLRGGEALRCLHALDSSAGCGFGPFCQQCAVRNTVQDTLANGATHRQVEASLPFEIAGKEEQLTFLLSAAPLGLTGEPLALVTMLDITQRVRVQQKLREASERWQQTFSAMRDGIALVDKEHRILQYNRAFGEIYGAANGELQGVFCYRVVHDSDCPIEGCPLVRAKQTGQRETMQMEINGSTYNIVVDPIRDAGGAVTGAVHVMTDITDLVQAEQRARQSLARQTAISQLAVSLGEVHGLEAVYGTIYAHVREMVDTKTFMVTSYDRRTKLIRAAYIVDQGKVQDVAGLPPIPLEPPGKGVQSQAIRSGEPFYAPDFRLAMQTTETKYRVAKNGSLSEGMPPDGDTEAWDDFTRSAIYVPMKVQGEVIGVMQAQSNRLDAYTQEDIELLSGMANLAAVAVQDARLIARLETAVAERTAELEDKLKKLTQSEKAMLYMVEDLNQIAADLKTERRHLELSNQELEAFAYSVSHDLRAPLRAINGYASFLARDHAPKLDAEGRRFIDVIQQSAVSMDRLISDLLSLSRVSRAELNRAVVDLRAVAQSVYQKTASPEEREAFIFEVQALPPVVCDPILLKQVWKNLIENALKYSVSAADKRITIGAQEQEGEIVYWIRDRGAGFDMQYAHKLFGVFQRLHSDAEYAGTGVGLAIVQRIIHRHGGRVWAEGEPGQGATFYFALPVD